MYTDILNLKLKIKMHLLNQFYIKYNFIGDVQQNIIFGIKTCSVPII